MTYKDLTSAEVVADTIYDGVRLTTTRVTFPNTVHKHILRHRLFSEEDGDTDASFSFASQRAAPVKGSTDKTEAHPFEPLNWRANGKGMSPKKHIEDAYKRQQAYESHRRILSFVAAEVRFMEDLGIHKEQANRYLEPFQWTTAIISSTNWENFFKQRDHEDAQEEIQILARAMRKALNESTPVERDFHVPFAKDILSLSMASGITETPESIMIHAVARCARVSYGRELEEKTYEEDVTLVERLLRSGHASPFEHIGLADSTENLNMVCNFQRPWAQLRHNWRAYLPSIAARLE